MVAQRTGLSTHVLRAWERRYGVVTPTRTEGGQRLYSDADIERLILLQTLTAGGGAISQLAQLPETTSPGWWRRSGSARNGGAAAVETGGQRGAVAGGGAARHRDARRLRCSAG